MNIACLGWGSLVWDARTLPLASQWFKTGPELPVEFCRRSNDGRITLVIAEATHPIPVLWAYLKADNAEQARELLAQREGITANNAERLIGLWSSTDLATCEKSSAIDSWARQAKLDAVVWTALGPKFSGAEAPACQEVVSYLASLEGDTRARAETYVRKAPTQIRTEYRASIEAALGWHPLAE